MNLHRLTTTTLPSIQIHGQDPMDTGSDHLSSSNSQRSLPREIPIPKHVSPTSSRCGSVHGSIPPIPPILSLDRPTPAIPHPNYNAYRHEDSTDYEESGSEGGRPRKVVLDVRDRRGRESQRGWTLSPMGRPSFDEPELSGSRDGFSIRSEDSFDRNWREGFYKRSFDERASPKELQSEESLRAQVQQSANAYDHGMLRKLNASTSDPSAFTRHRRTPPRPFTSGSEPTVPPLLSHYQRSLPASAAASPRTIDSPIQRWAQASAGEPIPSRPGTKHERYPPMFSPSLTEFRNNGDNASVSSHITDNDNPSNRDSRMRRSISASLLGPGYDSYNEDEDSQMEDAHSPHVSQMRHLTLQDARTPPHQYRTGFKRRASSPPNEDRMTGTSEPTRKGLLLESAGTELYNSNRRTPPIPHSLRTSPNSHPKHYHPSLPRSASGSFTSASASSAATAWSTSMGQASVASSLTTLDWASPVTPFTPTSDFELPKDASIRQMAPTSSPGSGARQKTAPETPVSSKEKEPIPPQPIVGRRVAPAMYICECCPKKPKRFDNAADLQLHELEKQYSCQYCNNRFKNKNEAERHQNSLHLRKHSWSCASLAGNYEAAFHQSPHRPNLADVCGYCGKEFPLPVQWAQRMEHLTTEHKFGECNQSKKFFRADHFRQHLKHSHSGTSGKWTNVLENSCMRDEIPPTPGNRSGMATPSISEEASE